MDLILFLKLVRDDTLRIGIGIEFNSFGAVYEYDLSNIMHSYLEDRYEKRFDCPIIYYKLRLNVWAVICAPTLSS